MEIQRNDLGAVTVLRPCGDIDLDGVNLLRLALLDCIREKRLNVVVSCGGIRNISYLGVGVLLERMRQLRKLGGDLRLAGMTLCVRRTLDMSSVTPLFVLCETESQACDSYREAA